MKNRKKITVIFLIIIGILLSSCGQKGPLYHPEEVANKSDQGH